MPDRELLVRIVGDDRDLQRALGSTSRRLEQIDNRTAAFGRNLTRAFGAAGIALGTAALFDAMGDAVDAASAVNEEIAKSEQVFGDSSKAIQNWSETTAEGFGVSQRAALEATGVFGNLFNVVGVAQEESAQMSQALVELAADLASFNNADPSDVLNAIRSGLIGEAEPLRRYGVLLSEARVQQVAMAQTGKDNVKELTSQEKALARYNIILQDTAPAQGDFARTSDSLANQSRILRAQLADLSAELGQNLVPILITATSAANGLFDAFDALGTGLRFDASETDLFELARALEAAREQIVGVAGDSHLMVRALDDALAKIREFQSVSAPRPDDRSGLRGPGAIAISNAQVDARAAEEAAARGRQAQRRRQKAFDEFIKGQGLKLDRAELTKTLEDDLEVLRAIERAIQRRIKQEGRTFDLAQQLTQVQLRIAAAIGQQQSEAARKETEAIEKRVEEQEKADRRRLERVRRRQERRREAQFEALGLTAEGDERTAGIGAIRRRGRNLIDQLQTSGLDQSEISSFVKRISVIFTDQFDNAGKDIRQAILDMFRTINQALDQGDKDSGRQITPGGIRPLQRLVAGANLTAEQIAILQKNMQRRRNGRPVNAFGVDFDSGTFTTGTFKSGGPGIVIEPQDVNIYLDGEKISNVVVKHMQKTGKRRTNRRGGAGAGRGAIL